MNKSGAAMPPVFDRFGASTQNVIVIYDDVALRSARFAFGREVRPAATMG